MKKGIIYLLFLAMLSSCNKSKKDTKTGLVGKFKLTQMLADPGDGSGTFELVKSNKIIEFHDNGKVSSNGELCEMSIASDHSTTGTYSITDSSINSSRCTNLRFEFIDNELIIHYPCIEGCSAKFEKL